MISPIIDSELLQDEERTMRQPFARGPRHLDIDEHLPVRRSIHDPPSVGRPLVSDNLEGSVEMRIVGRTAAGESDHCLQDVGAVVERNASAIRGV